MNDTSPQTPSSKDTLRLYIIALLILGAMYLGFDRWLDDQHNPNRDVMGMIIDGGAHEVILKQNRAGHYVATGKINGQSVTFFIDTGASDISVPAHIARRIGLKQGKATTYQTANGSAINYATTLNSVALGNIELRDLDASINPNVRNDDILLGMSFLGRLDFRQRGKKLILRQLRPES